MFRSNGSALLYNATQYPFNINKCKNTHTRLHLQYIFTLWEQNPAFATVFIHVFTFLIQKYTTCTRLLSAAILYFYHIIFVNQKAQWVPQHITLPERVEPLIKKQMCPCATLLSLSLSLSSKSVRGGYDDTVHLTKCVTIKPQHGKEEAKIRKKAAKLASQQEICGHEVTTCHGCEMLWMGLLKIRAGLLRSIVARVS